MKIGETLGPRMGEGTRQKTAGDLQGGDFKAILDELLARPSAPEAARSGALTLGGVAEAAKAIDPTRAADEVSGVRALFSGLEGTLDTLAWYAERLGDPGFPIEHLAPVLDRLEERVGDLNRLGAAGGVPAKLNEVLSDISIVVGTEIARLRRGDYDEGGAS
jgi:hypothetical protein